MPLPIPPSNSSDVPYSVSAPKPERVDLGLGLASNLSERPYAVSAPPLFRLAARFLTSNPSTRPYAVSADQRREFAHALLDFQSLREALRGFSISMADMANLDDAGPSNLSERPYAVSAAGPQSVS